MSVVIAHVGVRKTFIVTIKVTLTKSNAIER